MAQNRFKYGAARNTSMGGTVEDSFHIEESQNSQTGGLALPSSDGHYARRHSTGNVAGSINIAALQPRNQKKVNQFAPL